VPIQIFIEKLGYC